MRYYICVKKVITFCVGKLLHFALIILLHFALMLLHFVLVLHFAAIITFCGVTRSTCILSLVITYLILDSLLDPLKIDEQPISRV